jgi:hypothetical protein
MTIDIHIAKISVVIMEEINMFQPILPSIVISCEVYLLDVPTFWSI